ATLVLRCTLEPSGSLISAEWFHRRVSRGAIPLRLVQIRISRNLLLCQPEELADFQFQPGKQLLDERFVLGEDLFEREPIRTAMVHLDVVVAGIDHPKTRQIALFIKRLFADGVQAM